MNLFIYMISGWLLVFAPPAVVKKNSVHIVKMEGMRFNPKTIEIKAGETVRWINETKTTHNVVANDGSFKSAMLEQQGEQFEYTFTRAGTFSYYCRPHRIMGMKGVVVVK